MRCREVERAGRSKAADRMRYRRCRRLSGTEQNTESVSRCDLSGDRRELLTHEPRIASDDQRLTRDWFFGYQISADRFRDSPNVIERKLVGDDRSPAGGAEANRHTEPLNEKLLFYSSRLRDPSQLFDG